MRPHQEMAGLEGNMATQFYHKEPVTTYVVCPLVKSLELTITILNKYFMNLTLLILIINHGIGY